MNFWRGIPRPFGQGVDIGAYEYNNHVWLISPNQSKTYNTSNTVTLQWATYIPTAGNSVKFELWQMGSRVAGLGSAQDPSGTHSDPVVIPKVSTGNGHTFRVISESNPTLYDESDTSFTIQRLDASADDEWQFYD